MSKATVTLKHLHHQNEHQVGLYFSYNTSLIQAVKRIIGARWSRSNKCWYVKNNPANLQSIFSIFKGIAWIDKEDFFKHESQVESRVIKPKNIKSPKRKNIPEEYAKTLIRRRYSESTLKIYTSYFSEFVNHFPDIDLDQLTDDHIRQFQDYLVNVRKVATNTQNQAINAINPVGSI